MKIAITTSLIVDASVGIKWYIDEDHDEIARRLLREDWILHVPDLFHTELANIVWKRVRAAELTNLEADAILGEILVSDVQIASSTKLLPEALKIATATDRTVYDSLYLALAVQENSQCITADKRLYHALETGVFAPHIMWIENLPAR